MKKLLGLLVFLASPVLAQWVPLSDAWTRLDGGIPVPSGYLTIKDETTAQTQRSILTLLGAGVTCADSGANFATECTIPGGGGSTPTGTGFTHNTAGAQDAAAKLVDTADVNNNQITNALLAQMATLTLKGNNTAATSNAVDLTMSQTAAMLSTCAINPATCTSVFEDFNCKPEAITRIGCGDAFAVSSGGGSGPVSSTESLAVDANHPGMVEFGTGTTATGAGGVAFGTTQLLISGNETVEWMVYVPVASIATTVTHRFYAGYCDVLTNADCIDGLYFTWQNEVDTHWCINSSSNSTRTSTCSTTVATAAAWHKLKIVVNAGATSIAFFVDGAELNNSPLSTNIPTGAGRATGPMAKLAALGSDTTSKLFNVDYMYFLKTGISR